MDGPAVLLPRQQAKLARGTKDKERAMSQTSNTAIAVIGIDIGKNSFHVVGHDARGAIVLRQKWSRGQVEARLANVPPCLIGMEACVGAHHLSRKPAPERKRTTTWPAFIRTHLALLAGTDFFTAEVLTLRGLVTYYVLFFIHLESRQVDIAGITIHPAEPWMRQIARNVTVEGCGTLRDCRYLLHDRDTKYTQSFRAIIVSGRVEPLVRRALLAARPERIG
jgi:hypothetical protein